MRILKQNPILRLVNSYLVDSPQPSNISYLWNFGSLLALCLGIQILTGVFLAMQYAAHVDLAFDSVERIMSIVNLFFLCKTNFNSLINLRGSRGKSDTTSTDSKAIVVYGENLGSGLGFNYPITKIVRSMFNFPAYHFSVIIGLLLSDGWVGGSRGINPRFEFDQSTKSFAYAWHIFMILAPFCSSLPYFRTGVRKGKAFYSLKIFTRALPCIKFFVDLFYKDKVKFVPQDIFHYLTPVALTHWICGDGSKAGSGLLLSTESFSLKDVTLLVNVLMIRYELDCTIRGSAAESNLRIYIRSNSMDKVRAIVCPHIIESMKYKIY